MSSVTCLFQHQGIDSYITDNPFFLSHLEVFQAIMQDFYQNFKVCGANRCDQGFFLFGQLLGFFYRLLRRIISKSNLPAEEEWDSVHCFDFTGFSFLAFAELVKESHFPTAALRVRASVDVERQKWQGKSNSQVVTASVVKKTLTPFLESARNYMKFICEGLLHIVCGSQTW